MKPTGRRIRIGEVLVQEGILTEEQLKRALAEQKLSGAILGEMLVEQGMVSRKELIRVLSGRLGVRTACEEAGDKGEYA